MSYEPVYADDSARFNERARGYIDRSNPEIRCPCLLLLDTSGSMQSEDTYGKSAISKLNEGLLTIKRAIEQDSTARDRVELAVITFGGSVEIVSGFRPVDKFNPECLTASGGTPLRQALRKAIEFLRRQKDAYQKEGKPYDRPWIFLITDADRKGMDHGWESAVAEIRQQEAGGHLVFFPFGIEPADRSVLQQLDGEHVKACILKDNPGSIAELFKWLSNSLSRKSQAGGRGGQVSLPSTDSFTVPI